MESLNHYSILAEMFRYPEKVMTNQIAEWRALVMKYDAGLLNKLEGFVHFITDKPFSVQQEYYVSTFDVQPVVCLDIGFVLFGEDYKRGEFLVNIKKEQLRVANDCGSELPDHLPNVLTLLSAMKEKELAEELIYSLLIPAVTEMISKFRDMKNHYKGLLEILLSVMEKDYPESVYEKFQFPAGGSIKHDKIGIEPENIFGH